MITQPTCTARQIAAFYNVSRSSISDWHTRRTVTGFPPAHRLNGRYVWNTGDIDAWFAARQRTLRRSRNARADRLAHTGRPDELLTAREVAALLGHSSPNVLHSWRHHRPGYFPEPDERGPVSLPGRGRPPQMRWRRSTIVAWLRAAPGHTTSGASA